VRSWLTNAAHTVVKLASLTGAGIAVCLSCYAAFPHDWADVHVRLVVAGLLGGAAIGLLSAVLFEGWGLTASGLAAAVSGATIWGRGSIVVSEPVMYRVTDAGLKPMSQLPANELNYVTPLVAVCLLAGGLAGYAVFARPFENRPWLRDKLKPAAGAVCALGLASYVFSEVTLSGLSAGRHVVVMGLAPAVAGFLAGLSCGVLIRKWSYPAAIVVAVFTCVGWILAARILYAGAEQVGEGVPAYFYGFAYVLIVGSMASVGAVAGRLIWQSIAGGTRSGPEGSGSEIPDAAPSGP